MVGHRMALEEILAGSDAFDVELLPGGDAVASAERGGKSHPASG